MTQHQTKAFTLVELIVVITILAILGTIAFISLQGYSKSARDSSRVSDVNTIESSLELFALQSGYYPEPSDNIDVTFSGGQVWTQGTVGNSVSGLVQRLNKTPVDPLTGTEYTYSRLNTKGEIEVAAVLEDSDLSQVSNTYAGNLEGSAYVTGNYNGAVAKVSTGSNLYVLAVPTIISGDVSVTDYTSLIDQGELVFNGGEVLPASYDGSTFKTDTTSITGMSTGTIVVYNSGSSLPSNQAELDTFIANLQTAYSGSSVADSGNIAAIVNETDTNNLTVLAESLVENQLGGSVAITANSGPTGPLSYMDAGLCDVDDITYGAYTIAGCNLGTTTSGVGPTSYGSFFQWGNNNPFPNSGGLPSVSYLAVDTTGFGPGNYYSSGTFIATSNWANPQNNNLWGEVDDTHEARQGPCPDDYHVPAQTEWEGLHQATIGMNGTQKRDALQLPFAGYWNEGGNLSGPPGSRGSYWTSETNVSLAVRFDFGSSFIDSYDGTHRAFAMPIRCFKNN